LNGPPLVSVIIPAHNEEKALPRLLDSLLAQSYPSLQVFLVDDGSTDQTLAVARQYAEKDPRLTVLSQPRSGVSAARNRALNLCTGKYIRFADADDSLPPDSLRLLVRRAEADAADLVLSGYTEYIGDHARYKNLANREDTVSGHRMLEILNRRSNSYFYGVLWNKLFRRDLVGSLRFDETLFWGEDFSFVMSYLKQADTIAFMKDSVYDYRRTPGSTSFRQVLDSVLHPLKNIRIKIRLYRVLKDLYVSRGEYEAHRKTLWIYLFRFGLDI
jgi:glycosyltransferase involved in cell wall biosynthesis